MRGGGKGSGGSCEEKDEGVGWRGDLEWVFELREDLLIEGVMGMRGIEDNVCKSGITWILKKVDIKHVDVWA